MKGHLVPTSSMQESLHQSPYIMTISFAYLFIFSLLDLLQLSGKRHGKYTLTWQLFKWSYCLWSIKTCTHF